MNLLDFRTRLSRIYDSQRANIYKHSESTPTNKYRHSGSTPKNNYGRSGSTPKNNYRHSGSTSVMIISSLGVIYSAMSCPNLESSLPVPIRDYSQKPKQLLWENSQSVYFGSVGLNILDLYIWSIPLPVSVFNSSGSTHTFVGLLPEQWYSTFGSTPRPVKN